MLPVTGGYPTEKFSAVSPLGETILYKICG
jgi:hypothetical protein